MERDEAERKRARRRLAGAGVCALAAALIAGVWSERTPVAAHFADEALARRGVRATYRITRFGTASQRLENIVVGDPTHPDLVADWAEVRMSLGLNGPELHALSAGGVRLRGRIADGRLRLGDIDKLLPPPSGAPFSLPDIAVTLANARVALATPLGPVELTLDGRGRLVDDFAGHVVGEAPVLRSGKCAATDVNARLAVAIRDRRPLVSGPVTASRLDCGGARIADARLALDASATAMLDRWTGAAGLAAASFVTPGLRGHATDGKLSFDLAEGRSSGALTLSGRTIATTFARADAGSFHGRYSVDLARLGGNLDGVVQVRDANAGEAARARVAQIMAAGDAVTPVTPLLAALRPAVARSLTDVAGSARMTLSRADGVAYLTLARADLRSASGAHLSYATIDQGGTARLDGGGLPALDFAYRTARSGIDGRVQLAGVAAGGARLAPVQVRIDLDRDVTRLSARPLADGPLGSGRIEGLTAPVNLRIARDGSLAIDPVCADVAFKRLALPGATFDDGRLRLCPLGGALLTRGTDGRLGGGASIADLRLAGHSGRAPVAIEAADLRLPLDQAGFTARSASVRLGAGADPTRLTLASIDGRLAHGAIGGGFGGAAGAIADVPLLLSNGAGAWRIADGHLTVTGALAIADAQAASPRFRPIRGVDVRLKLAAGRILASGVLVEPGSGSPVADVTLRHDLRAGAGEARLTTRALAFTAGFQPDALTPLATGLVADVRGTLTGEATIDWDARGTQSTGTFRTTAMDLSAPFGPVKGLATELRFDDLLGLHTAPGQVATVEEINPGIAVTGGRASYQLAGGDRIAIEGARWPFFGGALTLAPTVLDFSAPAARRLTFRVDGLDAARFVEETGFDNLAVTGTFDGAVPLVFDQAGGRIEHGELAARAGGGRLAYVGEISRARLGRFGKLAFDALKSMRYTGLSIALDGSLDGEVVSQVLLDGISETPRDAADSLLLRRLAHLPFRFRVAIRAPFRGLVNSAASLNDPRGLIQNSLAAHATTVVQP